MYRVARRAATRVLNKKTETKYHDIAQENMQLSHNRGYQQFPLAPSTLGSDPVFFNCWQDISQGTRRWERIGDKITPRGMSIRLWLANKLDRPNIIYRVIIGTVPQVQNVTAVNANNIDWFQTANTGATGNRLILPLDTDAGFKTFYDKIFRNEAGFSSSVVGGNWVQRECHKFVKIWIRRKNARPIVYDNTNKINNRYIYMLILAYDSYGTLETDQIASYSYNCRMYYKDL